MRYTGVGYGKRNVLDHWSTSCYRGRVQGIGCSAAAGAARTINNGQRFGVEDVRTFSCLIGHNYVSTLDITCLSEDEGRTGISTGVEINACDVIMI